MNNRTGNRIDHTIELFPLLYSLEMFVVDYTADRNLVAFNCILKFRVRAIFCAIPVFTML